MTLKLQPVQIVVTALAAAALACGGPGTLPPGAGNTSTQLAAAPTPTPLPPVTSLEANLQARVAAGEWTLEAGLVASLQFLVEEVDEAAINPAGRQIVTYEATTLLDMAADYAANGSDAAVQSELQRLLDLVFPDLDQIKLYARPAATGQVGSVKNASVVRQPPVDCLELWHAGFPADRAVPCFEYQYASILGQTYEVYLPLEWPEGDPRRANANLVLEAIRQAASTYSPYGDLPPATVVFTLGQDPAHPNWDAAAIVARGVDHCQIAIHPSGGGLPDGNFKQVVAHEVFHCFEWQNYHDSMLDLSGRLWWSEAAAEYFSNVAYPEVNHEHRLSLMFDGASIDQTLFEMSYENFVFFQFFGNELNNGAIISLLAGAPPAGGASAQESYLASYPGMDDLFHRFAEHYMNIQIADSGGGVIPSIPETPEQITLNPTDVYPVPTRSFQVRRLVLVFPEDKRYALAEQDNEGLTGRVRPLSVADWQPLPANLTAGCNQRELVYLVTGTTPGGFTPQISSTVTDLERNVGCDRCLVGSWLMDNNSMWSSFAAIFSGSEFAPSLQSISGRVVATFTEDGMLSINHEGLAISYSQEINIGENVLRADASVLVSGLFISDWYTEEPNSILSTMVFSQPERTGQLVFTAGGVTRTADMGPVDFSVIPLGGGVYECSESTLLVGPVGGPPGGIQPILYTRLSAP